MKCPAFELLDFELLDNGDSAFTIMFKAKSSAELSCVIHTLAEKIRIDPGLSITEIIPAYQSLTICYAPLITSENHLKHRITHLLESNFSSPEITGRLIKIPVCYQPPYAQDIEHVSQQCQLSIDEIIQIHTKPQYLVHMLGFTPGFMYLGGLDHKLHCDRKLIPDKKVPAGSVGIGGAQTGIYPQETPGGWQIIGCTPLRLFRPEKSKPFLTTPLDRVQFFAVSGSKFERLKRKA